MRDGQRMEGEIVYASKSAIMIRRSSGALEQLSRRAIESSLSAQPQSSNRMRQHRPKATGADRTATPEYGSGCWLGKPTLEQ